MTEIRIGMSVQLVKMANYDAELKRNGIGLGDIGVVMGASDPCGDDEPLWKVRFTRHGLDKIFWLGCENIEPTSPAGVKIESPAVRGAGFYWVKQYDVWWPACLEADGTYSVASNPSGYSDPASAFDEIGPRIEPPEGDFTKRCNQFIQDTYTHRPPSIIDMLRATGHQFSADEDPIAMTTAIVCADLTEEEMRKIAGATTPIWTVRINGLSPTQILCQEKLP